MKKMIIAGLVVIISIVVISTFVLVSCSQKNKNKTGFDDKISPYSKEEVTEYSYNVTGNKLTIRSNCSDLKIKKDNVSEVKITMKKMVGGKTEDDLKTLLDKMYCELKDEVININQNLEKESNVNSTNVESIITIPSNINSVEIESNIGDITLEDNYDMLNINMNIGDLEYAGELKECDIFSKIGETKLKLQNLDDDYKYKINGEIGDVKITLQKGSKINLVGSMAKNVKVKDEINIDNNGSIFDINKKVSDITISN